MFCKNKLLIITDKLNFSYENKIAIKIDGIQYKLDAIANLAWLNSA
jgi:hypothetical protein